MLLNARIQPRSGLVIYRAGKIRYCQETRNESGGFFQSLLCEINRISSHISAERRMNMLNETPVAASYTPQSLLAKKEERHQSKAQQTDDEKRAIQY